MDSKATIDTAALSEVIGGQLLPPPDIKTPPMAIPSNPLLYSAVVLSTPMQAMLDASNAWRKAFFGQ
jgi:hypothetical protein